MITPNNDRPCGECTMCCQGHLSGTAYGYDFSPNKPCHFLSKNGCSIYSYRPYDPCKTFKCEWKVNKDIPEEFRPDKSKVIFVHRIYDDTPTLDAIDCGKPINADILHLIIKLFNDHKYNNIRYQKDGFWQYLQR